jgi:hypothetical protein
MTLDRTRNSRVTWTIHCRQWKFGEWYIYAKYRDVSTTSTIKRKLVTIAIRDHDPRLALIGNYRSRLSLQSLKLLSLSKKKKTNKQTNKQRNKQKYSRVKYPRSDYLFTYIASHRMAHHRIIADTITRHR